MTQCRSGKARIAATMSGWIMHLSDGHQQPSRPHAPPETATDTHRQPQQEPGRSSHLMFAKRHPALADGTPSSTGPMRLTFRCPLTSSTDHDGYRKGR